MCFGFVASRGYRHEQRQRKRDMRTYQDDSVRASLPRRQVIACYVGIQCILKVVLTVGTYGL
jgi:hypothetical protein